MTDLEKAAVRELMKMADCASYYLRSDAHKAGVLQSTKNSEHERLHKAIDVCKVLLGEEEDE